MTLSIEEKRGTGTSGPARLLVPALRTGEYRIRMRPELMMLSCSVPKQMLV